MKPNTRFTKLNLSGRRKWFVAGAAGVAAATAIATTVAVAPATHASAVNTPSAAAAAAKAHNTATNVKGTTAQVKGKVGEPKSTDAFPKLTTDTPATCNTKPAPGHVECDAIIRTAANHAVPQLDAPPATALGPADIQSAYNLPANAGGGQTIADVIWGDDATLESDLGVFRAEYNLPPCTTANGCFRKVNQQGQQSDYPPDQGSGVETSLDVDAYSSACPNCNILVVEANTSSFEDLGAAENEAVALGAKFVSNSYGTGDGQAEDPSETGFDQYYNHQGVAVTVSAGDGGWGVSYPAADPNVVSVGGTLLTKDSTVARGWDETVWGNGTEGVHGDGTGSGCSEDEPQPTWQEGLSALTAVCPANRGVADVSADASPSSGLAVYDSNPNDSSEISGWGQVGGTSLAAPLIAGMYALAGTPAADTYPVTYPYQNTADLNDVTSGSNGTCGNVLCNGATGWDGPTGLGTPNGVQALADGPQGTISGQVTDASTGKPIAGVRVVASPGGFAATTDANGNYTLAIAIGTYSLAFSDFDFQSATQSGVQVSDNQTTTKNATLTALPLTTVSGTVTDGSGHGWPLYAEVSINGDPNGPVFTDPTTGKFGVTLPQGPQTFQVTPVYNGYQAATQAVQLNQPNQTVNVAPQVDATSCTAPGYGWDGVGTDFLGWTGATAIGGWTRTGSASGWRFDDPGNRQSPPGGDDNFAIADSNYSGNKPVNTTLTSPSINLSGQSNPTVSFDSRYLGAPGQVGSVEVSSDRGRHWTTLWRNTTAISAAGPVPLVGGSPPLQLALPTKPNTQVRFSFTGRDGGYWAIDNVFIGTRICSPQPGGLIIGDVTDAASGAGLPGVTIYRNADPAHPATTVATIDDSAVSDGFYWLFVPAGLNQLTASDDGYTTARQAVPVKSGQVVRHDWALKAAS